MVLSWLNYRLQVWNSFLKWTTSLLFSKIRGQALSGDFQHACGKMHAQIQLGVRWCTMCFFLCVRFYNFIKGIVILYIVFLKEAKTILFILMNLFCLTKLTLKYGKRIDLNCFIPFIKLEEYQNHHFPIHS